MKIINDQFYTDFKVAKKCFKFLDKFLNYDVLIEPSAGEGVFSGMNNKVISYDIDPKKNTIIKQDFLKLERKKEWGDKILFFGNPPFGHRSSLAKQFIKKCISLGATTIAFILPNTFSKISNQKYNLFPKEWRLINEVNLDKDAFYVYKNFTKIKYHVPCSFFIWTIDNEIKDKNIRKWPPKIKPKEFMFLKRDDKSADLVINGNSGKVKKPEKVTNPKSEHYIKILDKSNFDKIKHRLENLKYDTKSSINGGNFWINQTEIIIAWLNEMNYEKEN